LGKEGSFDFFPLIAKFLRSIRWVLILALGTLTLVFVAEFLINFLFINSAILEKLSVVRFTRAITEPVVRQITSIIRFKTKYHDVEWTPLILAAIIYFLMSFLSRQFQQFAAVVDAEYQLRRVRSRRPEGKSIEGLSFSSTSTDKAIRGFWSRWLRRKEAERDKLLREFSEAKKRLEKSKQRLAFLSVDIVGSTRIKEGRDPLLLERLFREYRYLLEHIFKKHRYRAASWTPDGVMVCFPHVELGCGAARDLLRKLPSFNKDKNPLDFPVEVRCGLNAGEVLYDEATPLELLSDRVLDITGHLQKAARPNSLLVTEEVFQQLRDRKEFAPGTQEVDGFRVYEWSQVPISSQAQLG